MQKRIAEDDEVAIQLDTSREPWSVDTALVRRPTLAVG